MSYNCCSGNFSSRSFGGYLRYPRSSCGFSYPSNLVYCPYLCSPSTCQLGSSLYSDCQETCYEPTSCQTSCVVSSPCQTSCYRPRTSFFCSPCQMTYSGSLGFGSRGFPSFGCGSQSVGCGPKAFSSLNNRSNFYGPTYFSSRSCQSASYQPACESGFY
ncbi:keratin-associated protein 13-1-like [Microcebus murinus]|uniref:keratin-associated protein 13-1-like n=1 Tax=Microcebus murinus TaxID=30608 RepID=UPI003F6CE7C5